MYHLIKSQTFRPNGSGEIDPVEESQNPADQAGKGQKKGAGKKGFLRGVSWNMVGASETGKLLLLYEKNKNIRTELFYSIPIEIVGILWYSKDRMKETERRSVLIWKNDIS